MGSYFLDYKNLSIEELKEKIKNTELLPSQKILLEKIDERFETIENQKIYTLYDLQEILKTKNKCLAFSKKTGISENYLIVLRREVNSYQAKSRKLKEFECIKDELIERLEKRGVNDTGQLFGLVSTVNGRMKLAEELDLEPDEATVLAKLTDVSRLRYVSPNFATILINSKYDTVEKIQKADCNELYKDLSEINKKKCHFKGNFGLNDMKFFVNDSKFIPLVMEY